MEDTYKGDSPSKKVARYHYWFGVRNLLGGKQFLEGKHLILASREGGDISTLFGMGVPPQNIVAVDSNGEAAQAVQEKYPEIRVICGDVGRIARQHKRTISSAFLDFCNPLSPALIEKAKEVVVHGLKSDAVLGCGFLCGREKDRAFLDKIELKKKELVESMEQASKDIDNVQKQLHSFRDNLKRKGIYLPQRRAFSTPEDEKTYLLSADKYLDREIATVSRLGMFGEALNTKLVPLISTVFPSQCIGYMSSSRQSHGVPMGIFLGKLYRGAVGMKKEMFLRKLGETFDTTSAEYPVLMLDETEDSFREFVLRSIEDCAKDIKTIPPTEVFALLMNISTGTIAAWKAHRTRGTYGKEKKA